MSPATTETQGAGSSASLQARVTGILTKPAAEWQVIAGERTDVASLYKNYIAILAAIPAVCLFLSLSLLSAFFGFAFALRVGLSMYIRSLVMVYVSAFVIQKLAANFQSDGDLMQAMKLVTYAYTPVWIAGVLNLTIILAPLEILAGLYAIYLFYLGVGPVMKTPTDKVVPYMIVSAIAIVVVGIVLSLVLRMLTPGYAGYGWM